MGEVVQGTEFLRLATVIDRSIIELALAGSGCRHGRPPKVGTATSRFARLWQSPFSARGWPARRRPGAGYFMSIFSVWMDQFHPLVEPVWTILTYLAASGFLKASTVTGSSPLPVSAGVPHVLPSNDTYTS